jgi:hypothetical protein
LFNEGDVFSYKEIKQATAIGMLSLTIFVLFNQYNKSFECIFSLKIKQQIFNRPNQFFLVGFL